MATFDSLLRQLELTAGLEGVAPRLGRVLALSADPEHAPPRAAALLESAARADGARLRRVWELAPEKIALTLSSLCGAAPFFVPIFVQRPRDLIDLFAEDFLSVRSAVEYETRLVAALQPGSAGGREEVLRRFKYYELARITVRETATALVSPSPAGGTLAELSHLADALLAQALAEAGRRLEAACGPPCWQGPGGAEIHLGFCVLGLGKLGSEELNYSSDVDLLYVFQDPPPPGGGKLAGGPQGLSPLEYFTRLAQEFGRLVSEPTGERFLYRIDLDLRPEGTRGPLVVSGEMLAKYYEVWAATWEKAAFMKARPVAGDKDLGWRTIRTIAPMIYRASMDLGGVAAIKHLREEVERATEPPRGAFNVKTGSGGIREVEFVAQALQLLHGGRIPQVRGRSTPAALAALRDVGILPEREAEQLLAAYYFLRRTENRLQMEAERQVHQLPVEPEPLARVARAMGFSGSNCAAAFTAALDRHRRRVRHIAARLFDEEEGEGILTLFARSAPQLVGNPATRPMIENLAQQFAREIRSSPDPERAINNLDRFVRGLGRRRFYYELLLDRPELVPRLAGLFGASEYLSTYLATHPQLIEPIFSDPNVLLLSREQLAAAFAKIRGDLVAGAGRSETELGLDALRQFHNRELVNVGLLDLAGKVTPPAAQEALSDIARVCVEEALALAQAETKRRGGAQPQVIEAAQFLVVGMGKLATGEITYGSDLDVIFLYDLKGGTHAELLVAQEYFVRLAQKLIWALQTRTGEGVCYEIDARLRPSGNQGMLVASLPSFARYHHESAQVWERQALLRARPLAGDAALGRAFERQRLEILRQPVPAGLAGEIHRIRLRMESELARERAGHHDIKTGRGGLNDVESAVQYLQLLHGARHAELFTVAPVAVHLDRLEGLGLLGREEACVLREGWKFLQLLAGRLRVVENRSISDLDEGRGDLDAVARQLGYAGAHRAGSARRALLDDYRRHVGMIRAVYLKLLGLDA